MRRTISFRPLFFLPAAGREFDPLSCQSWHRSCYRRRRRERGWRRRRASLSVAPRPAGASAESLSGFALSAVQASPLSAPPAHRFRRRVRGLLCHAPGNAVPQFLATAWPAARALALRWRSPPRCPGPNRAHSPPCWAHPLGFAASHTTLSPRELPDRPVAEALGSANGGSIAADGWAELEVLGTGG